MKKKIGTGRRLIDRCLIRRTSDSDQFLVRPEAICNYNYRRNGIPTKMLKVHGKKTPLTVIVIARFPCYTYCITDKITSGSGHDMRVTQSRHIVMFSHVRSTMTQRSNDKSFEKRIRIQRQRRKRKRLAISTTVSSDFRISIHIISKNFQGLFMIIIIMLGALNNYRKLLSVSSPWLRLGLQLSTQISTAFHPQQITKQTGHCKLPHDHYMNLCPFIIDRGW